MSKSRSIADVSQNINTLEAYRRELRARERGLLAREKALLGEFQVPNSNPEKTKNNLIHELPEHMVPGNIGALYEVSWPFWYQTNFDFGNNVSFSSTLSQLRSFQVTQEAAFILLSISRSSYDENSVSGALGPWQIQLTDRQSSRQLQSNPIPFQCFGSQGNATILPTGFLLMPNAFVDVTMSSFASVPFASTGSGKHQMSFHGVRIRIDAADKIISQIYG